MSKPETGIDPPPRSGFLRRRLRSSLVGRLIAVVQASSAPEIDEPPPFWSKWSRIYWVVAGLLAADILLFRLLGWWAS